MDVSSFEKEIDLINEKLITLYSRPPGCCKKVKNAIMKRIAEKQAQYPIQFTYEDVQEIGKELIHQGSMFDYLTFLNRKTFNDVLHRLMIKKLIGSPYFNVPQQRHREVYTDFKRVDYKELLLIEAADRELRSFEIDEFGRGGSDRSTLETLLCNIIASCAIHGAMLFRGFHQELLSCDSADIDLKNNFIQLRLHGETDNKDSTSFFRYFISPITMVYLLLFSIHRAKELKRLNKKRSNDRDYFFGQGPNETKKVNVFFREWTKEIAKKYGLDFCMDIDRFRLVSIRYLSVKYPVFLLSVHTRSLRSDSLNIDYFGPLLNIKSDSANESTFRQNPIAAGKKCVSDRITEASTNDDKYIHTAVSRIISLRGHIKEKADCKRIAPEIRKVMDEVLTPTKKGSSDYSPVLKNYELYWNWLLYLIEAKRMFGGSLGTYTGGIGTKFIPSLDVGILETDKEYLQQRILDCAKDYETNSLIKNLRRFFSYIKLDHPDADLPSLSQKQFIGSMCSSPKPLFYFKDVTMVLWAVPDRNLRLMIILGC